MERAIASTRLIETAYNAAVARGDIDLAYELQRAWLGVIDHCLAGVRAAENRRLTIALLMIIAQTQTDRRLPLTALANVGIIARSALDPVNW